MKLKVLAFLALFATSATAHEPGCCCKPELNIKAGKFYKLRGGAKARIYATDGTQHWPTHGAAHSNGTWVMEVWTAQGCYHLDCLESYKDIIGPWED